MLPHGIFAVRSDVNGWRRHCAPDQMEGVLANTSASALIIGMIAGAIGVGYFVYGKRQQRLATMMAGLMLGIYPFFTDNPLLLLLIGALLMAVPFITDF